MTDPVAVKLIQSMIRMGLTPPQITSRMNCLNRCAARYANTAVRTVPAWQMLPENERRGFFIHKGF